MPTLNVRFHRGGGRWAAFSWVIKTWTRSEYSHVELEFPNNRSFSSRENGVDFKKIDYGKHPERWNTIAIGVTQKRLQEILEHCYLHRGQQYDWWGIVLDRVFKTKVHKEDAWFCSEIIAHILEIKPELCSPGSLFKALKKRA